MWSTHQRITYFTATLSLVTAISNSSHQILMLKFNRYIKAVLSLLHYNFIQK